MNVHIQSHKNLRGTLASGLVIYRDAYRAQKTKKLKLKVVECVLLTAFVIFSYI